MRSRFSPKRSLGPFLSLWKRSQGGTLAEHVESSTAGDKNMRMRADCAHSYPHFVDNHAVSESYPQEKASIILAETPSVRNEFRFLSTKTRGVQVYYRQIVSFVEMVVGISTAGFFRFRACPQAAGSADRFLTFAERNALMEKDFLGRETRSRTWILEGGAAEHEAYVQAQRAEAQEGARIPQADEHEERPQGAGGPPPQGQKGYQRVISAGRP